MYIINTMDNTDSEHSLTDEQVLPVKPKQVPVKRAIWRYNDDGTYNFKPLSESYFQDYYKNHFVLVECPHCRKTMNKTKLNAHVNQSKRCLKLRNENKNL